MSAPYLELIAGTEQLVTTRGHFTASGDVIPALTPLMLDDNGTLVPWDGESTTHAVYVSAVEVDTSRRTVAQVYKTGVLNIAVINWPEYVTAEEAKAAAFAGSGISVQPLAF